MPNENYMLLMIRAEMPEGDDWAGASKRFIATQEALEAILKNDGFTEVETTRKRKSRRVAAKAGPQA